MTGYHYTSYDDWLKIQKEGMIPYKIKTLNIVQPGYPPIKNLKGIWLWKNRFHGVGHAGSIVFQAAMKATPHVVLLAVEYNKKDVWKYENYNMVITHDGHIENWVYHAGEESVILTRPIMPEKIHLVKEFDIVELLK